MKQKKFPAIVFIITAVIIFVIVFVIYIFFFHHISKETKDWDAFGSYLAGTLGILFGLVSVIILYITLNKQTELSTIQHFESAFFSLLNNQREILKLLKNPASFPVEMYGATYETGNDYMNIITKNIESELDGFSALKTIVMIKTN